MKIIDQIEQFIICMTLGILIVIIEIIHIEYKIWSKEKRRNNNETRKV